MRAVLIATILAMTGIGTGTASAADSDVIHGGTVELYKEESHPGEALHTFVVRLAPRALEASKTARASVCGHIEGTGPYLVKVKTDGYMSTCDLPKNSTPYVLVNGTATDARENHFSLANRNRPGYLVTPWAVKFQDRAGVRTVSSF